MNYKKDILFNTIGQFSWLFALWVTTVIVARTIGFEMAGILSLAITTANIYIPIASYNLRYYIAADIEKRYSDNQFLLARLLSTFASALICGCVVSIQNYDYKQLIAILLFYIFKMIEYVSDILYGILQRNGKLYLAGISLLCKAVSTIAVFSVIIVFGKKLNWALLGIIIVSFVFLFQVDFRYTRSVSSNLGSVKKNDFKEAIQVLQTSVLLFLVPLCSNLLTSIPRLFFVESYSTEQFGIYSSLATVTILISTAVTCVMIPMVPKYAEYYIKRKQKELCKITLLSFLLTIIVGGIGFAGVKVFGNLGFSILFGKDILPYLKYIDGIIFSTILTAVLVCFNTLFTAMQKHKPLLLGSLLGVIIVFLLSKTFCQKYFINGISYCLIVAQVSEIIFFTIYGFMAIKRMNKQGEEI